MSHTYNFQTVSSTILADLYTPVGVYLSLRGLYPQSALMESSDYHSHDTARSFIAIHPMASFAVSHGVAITSLPDGTGLRQPLDLDRKGVAKEQVAQARCGRRHAARQRRPRYALCHVSRPDSL